MDERRFARARTADDADRLAGARHEGDVGERIAAARIGEGDVLEAHRGVVRMAHGEHGLEDGGLPLPIEHLPHALLTGDRLRHRDDEVGELDELDEDLRKIAVKRDDIAL